MCITETCYQICVEEEAWSGFKLCLERRVIDHRYHVDRDLGVSHIDSAIWRPVPHIDSALPSLSAGMRSASPNTKLNIPNIPISNKFQKKYNSRRIDCGKYWYIAGPLFVGTYFSVAVSHLANFMRVVIFVINWCWWREILECALFQTYVISLLVQHVHGTCT